MAVYNDLSESEERMVYTKWNLGVKQSIDDFIWSYRMELPMYNTMLSDLPVTVYGSSEKIKFRYIVDAYLSTLLKSSSTSQILFAGTFTFNDLFISCFISHSLEYMFFHVWLFNLLTNL